MTVLQAGAWIDFEITYLDMEVAPQTPAPALRHGATIEAFGAPGPERFLSYYSRVGAEYEWTDWLAKPAEELADYANDPGRELYVLRLQDGSEGGFFILDFTEHPTADLAYFGLLPNAVGGGYGRAFLAHAVQKLWARDGVTKVTVNTCTLDHPRALPLYKSVGFRPVSKVWAQRVLSKPREVPMRRSS